MTKDLNNDVHQHRPEFNSKSKLAQLHTEKLLECAIPLEVHYQLAMASVGDDILEISYLNEDGTETLTRDGKPFVRERLSQAERDRRWTSRKRDDHKAKRPGKYCSPSNNGCRLYHSPLCVKQSDYQERLANIQVELRITEGELKTIAANLHDPKVITIGIGGVSSWRDRYDGQGKDEPSKPIIELEDLLLKDRRVRLCFDSDLHKPQVRAALKDLAHYLDKRGAIVLIEVLPSLPEQDSNGDWIRLGVDDLIYRCGAEAFQQIKKIAKPAFKGKAKKKEFSPEFEPKNTCCRNVYLKALIGHNWRANQEQSGAWWQWIGTHWQLVHSSDALLRIIENVMEANRWENREQATVNSLLAAFRRSVELDLPRPDKGLVPCLNGCLRLSDNTLIPHNPQHGNTYCLPFDFNPLAPSAPIIDVLLTMVTKVELTMFQAALQSIVTGKHRKAFLEITGPGNSGKSVFGRLATAIAGVSNTVAVDLEKIEEKRNRFETIKLRGALLAVFNECDKYSGPLNVLKSMTGGDKITAELKNSVAQVDFYFEGMALLIGNNAVKPSDTTGAVINRRRSIDVPAVISTADERELLEPDSDGWRGEFAAHLSGLLNWALEISEADAKQALGKDSNDIGRIKRDRDTLLDTDPLAQWAEEHLIYDPEHSYSRVGNPRSQYQKKEIEREHWENLLFPHYEEHVDFPVGLVKFKNKLIDMLRDTFGLPLPKGSTRHGDYKVRNVGSVIPNVRLRRSGDEDMDGIITQATMWRLSSSCNGFPATDQQIGNGQTPVGKGCNGCNGFNEVTEIEETTPLAFTSYGSESEKPPQTRSSSYCKGSAHYGPVTPCQDPLRPANSSDSDRFNQDQKHLKNLPSMPSMNVEAATTYSWISAASDGLHDASKVPNENNIFEVLCSWKKAPSIPLQQIKDIIQTHPEVLRNTLDIKY